MPQTQTQEHYNEVLTNLAVVFRPPVRRWDEVLRIIPVDTESDNYAVFDRFLYMSDGTDSYRAPGAPAKEVEIGWKYDTFKCRERARKAKIPKETYAKGRADIDQQALKARAVKAQVDNDIELAVFGANGMLRTQANNAYVNTGADFTNPATAPVRDTFNTAIVQVKGNCGHAANVVVATAQVFLKITNCTQYLDAVRYFSDRATKGGIPDEIFGLKTIVVDSQVNTAKRGQNVNSTSFLMGGDIWIGYVAPGETGVEEADGGLQPNVLQQEVMTFGAMLDLSGSEYTSSWWDNDLQSDWVQYGRSFDLKVIAKECGGLITNPFNL